MIRKASSNGKPIVIRSVYASNAEAEMKLLSESIDQFSFISMDTEFPGVIHHPHKHHTLLRPSDHYLYLRKNVADLKLIQVGITLSDSDGNLPDLGTGEDQFIWEFNLDFDLATDLFAHGSIELLQQQGIDFVKIREEGIASARFGGLMMSSGLLLNESVIWVTFHSAHDFGYLVKILTGKDLPEELGEFLKLLRVFFGPEYYDIKYLMRFCQDLYGGLDRIAEKLQVDRAVGKSHQAGSDSLLTWHAFQTIRERYFCKDGLEKYARVVFGLEEVY